MILIPFLVPWNFNQYKEEPIDPAVLGKIRLSRQRQEELAIEMVDKVVQLEHLRALAHHPK